MNSFPLFNVIIAAALSAALYIILKFFRRWNIHNLQGLTFNYLTASLMAFFITREKNVSLLYQVPHILPPALLIGMLFITVFYITAMTAQKSGLAVTSIAGKMSMVIPIIAGILLYNDSVSVLRISGIILALAAVVLSSTGPSIESDSQVKKNLWLPVLLFLGSGLVDTSIKISEHYFITPDNINLYFSFLFGTAGCFGVIKLAINYFRYKQKIELKSVWAGILLGTTNYYSLVFLVRALAAPGAESSLIFAIVNMLVVIISTVCGILIFLEKPGKLKLAGIGISLAAIYILSR